MEKIKAVILAAGKGTRMNSDLPKVVQEIEHRPMVEYVIDAVKAAGANEICLVVGYQAEVVKRSVKSKVSYAMQEEQLGTGHAVKCARDFIGTEGSTLVLCGDTPVITGKTLKKLIRHHQENHNAITVLSAFVENPTGYGRIIRDKNGDFVKIVEQKDASEEELKSKEINSGMYIFDSGALSEALELLNNHNAQGEYYLPDTLTIIKEKGKKADAFVLSDASEIAGVNTPEQLAEAEFIMHSRVL